MKRYFRASPERLRRCAYAPTRSPELLRVPEAARSDYEQRLDSVVEPRQRLTEEAALVSFLMGDVSVSMRRPVRVGEGSVGGFVQDVSVPDMLVALRDGLANLEFEALRGTNSRER